MSAWGICYQSYDSYNVNCRDNTDINQRRKHMTNQALNMTNDELMRAAFNMEQNGGHFARALAKAFYAADSGNRRRILEAFGHMFVDYSAADILG